MPGGLLRQPSAASGACASTMPRLLPDAPGVNPQGTVMAVATRNVAAFLA